jgi:hypothetical protein
LDEWSGIAVEKQAMLISGHRTRSIFERYNLIDERSNGSRAKHLAGHRRHPGED